MNQTFGLIISYRLDGWSPVERTRFNRKFLGYNDKSQYGKYSYFREGLMTKIPHVHVSKSLFIILEDDLKRVKSFCDEYKVELFIRKVVLIRSDIRALSK